MVNTELAVANRLRERLVVVALGALAAGCDSLSSGGSEVEPGEAGQLCFAPRTVMRAVGTGQTASAPPASAYDANGCLPLNEVSNGCCNAPVSGPNFKGGECCYDFPANASCCGRPFIVDGQAQLAAVVRGRGWLGRAGGGPDGAADELAKSNATTRRALADGWLRDARMEHASVASFARFVGDLVGLGAPAELVRDAGNALLDEVEHASLCFALASRFAGEELAPAAMPAASVAQARNFQTIVHDALTEGCLGETAAAYVATLRLGAARDPQARRALERIASDEARHAELAFRFVAWALQQRRAEVELVIKEALAEMSAKGPVCTLESDLVERAAFEQMGLFAESDERAATKLAFEQIARPALELLCGLAADQLGPSA